ncbi:MAG: 1-acyl-sn-glycerol-3-phosphate acyltransferase [Lachnospiraceae bacterium]|nr:1-acyl-sn-glycerol-3-phosphate acyltransferase [Lachnospiraceae bacterium]
MDEYQRHQIIWRALYPVVHGFLCRKFHFTHDQLEVKGPCLIISNHVTNWDPLLVAMSLKHMQTYFVASEHIFRWGWLSKLLHWLLGPIARKKASSAAGTVMECMRHLKDGHSIGLFAEGDCTWNGITGSVFPATGKLAKSSGASLVTYRLEGGYLTFPRWTTKMRKGQMHGHVVHIYSPEELKSMSAKEVTAAINRDIYENSWENQTLHPIPYYGKELASGMESAISLCPACHRFGDLQSRGDLFYCDCGFSVRYLPTGFFSPAQPFRHIAEWDAWQAAEIAKLAGKEKEMFFQDTDVTLIRVEDGHKDTVLGTGLLDQFIDHISCAGQTFAYQDISDMAMVQNHMLLFTCKDVYYQLKTAKGKNLRKYLLFWQQHRS